MKRVISLVVVLCVAGVSYCGEKPKSNDTPSKVSGNNDGMALFPIEQNDKYGYINKTGEVVITPQFDYATGFSEGLAPVNVGGTSIRLDTGNPLYNSMSIKGVSGGKWGFIDKKGKIVIEPKFDGVGGFDKNGLASVNLGATGIYKTLPIPKGGKWGVIDRTGKMVIPAKYNFELFFYDGLAAFNVGGKQDSSGLVIDGKWGCLDKTGKIVIEPKFDTFFYFSDGLANVSVDGHYASTTFPGSDEPVDFLEDNKWGFIDTSGNFVIKPLYQAAYNFSEGLAAVKLEEKYGYIDSTNKFVIPPQYDSADPFSEGLAYVSKKDFCGFINKKGEVVIKLEYVRGIIEHENGKPVTKEGMPVFKGRKDQTGSRFIDGLSIVTEITDKEIRCGVIDKKGKFVIPLEARRLSYFKDGIFMVIVTGSKRGYMDSTGKYIWKPTE